MEDHDLEEFVDNFLLQFGQQQLPEMFSKETLLARIKDDEQTNGSILQKKYTDFLLDFATIEEIDYEDYFKLKEKKEITNDNTVPNDTPLPSDKPSDSLF